MVLSTVGFPRLHIATSTTAAVGQVGGVLLTETIRASGLDRALGEALLPWRKPNAVHDPGKVILDLAATLALGGDTLADIEVLRSEPGLYVPVASDPTVSRVIAALAADAPAALRAINTARATARSAAWRLAGGHAPDHARDVKSPTGHRPGRDAGHGALGEGAAGTDVQARLRLPPALRLPRPRWRGHWGTAGDPATPGQRRVEHCCRSHRRGPGCTRPAPRAQWPPARNEVDPGPRRRRRRHQSGSSQSRV